jgi:hypothetical protein
MERSRNAKVANLEVTIALLQRRERRLRSTLSSTQASPKGKVEANNDLVALLKKIEMAADELKRLESGQ